MVTYPIYVPRTNYRGSDPKKTRKVIAKNKMAADLQLAINEKVEKQDRRYVSYTWGEFTDTTGYTFEELATVGYCIDGGSNGFTVARPEFPEI